MRANPAGYLALDLRAHALLEGVPLHDVWGVDLAGGGEGRTVLDLRDLMSMEAVAGSNPVVRFFFGLRAVLGRWFGWDRAPSGASGASYLAKLTAADRAASLVAPGTAEGPFRVLYVSPREAISETINATVHAFLVMVLVAQPGGYRFYWAIYVKPVGRITSWYMRLIDPFRRFLIYPAVLRRVAVSWAEEFP